MPPLLVFCSPLGSSNWYALIHHLKSPNRFTTQSQQKTPKAFGVFFFVFGFRCSRRYTDTVLLSKPKEVFTEKFKNYKSLIPESIHTTRRRCNNHIERMNLNLRTHLKRLNRRTICYSK
ncbi:IS1 family transposase [Putridiphycobacter roseus]|uniref:IS1 family transposase n=1 Tax=Putridiphycobacter roseus TaxID=2219161 RepID=UPI0018F1344F|nr:IS1 family transposase [Putridiphycobacter roseus]